MDKREFYHRVKQATVAIVMELPNDVPQKSFAIIGSGFCIHPAGIIATSGTVFRAFFDKRAYREILNELQETTNPRPIERCYISQQPQVMIFGDSPDGQVFSSVIGVVEVVAGLGFDITLFKLPEQDTFASGYPTIEIADFSELHETQEIATCGFPLRKGRLDQLNTVSSSFMAGRISSIVPRADVSVSDVRGYSLDLTATIG